MSDSPVAIVTGGAQGIGAAICVELLRKGYRVSKCWIYNINLKSNIHRIGRKNNRNFFSVDDNELLKR